MTGSTECSVQGDIVANESKKREPPPVPILACNGWFEDRLVTNIWIDYFGGSAGGSAAKLLRGGGKGAKRRGSPAGSGRRDPQLGDESAHRHGGRSDLEAEAEARVCSVGGSRFLFSLLMFSRFSAAPRGRGDPFLLF